MGLTDRETALVRATTYPILQEPDPMDLVERVVDMIIDVRPLHASPEEYLGALRRAATDEDAITARITALRMPEETVRTFIRAVVEALQKRLDA